MSVAKLKKGGGEYYQINSKSGLVEPYAYVLRRMADN
jgi:hypothetical protein